MLEERRGHEGLGRPTCDESSRGVGQSKELRRAAQVPEGGDQDTGDPWAVEVYTGR